MATWVTHLMIADNVMKQCHELDRHAHAVISSQLLTVKGSSYEF